jgi:hypothetical protein
MNAATRDIAGYSYDQPDLARSPVTVDDLDLLRRTVLLGPDDDRYLRMAGDVLADQIDDLLDTWYGFVGSHPHLLAYFSPPEGEPIPRYLEQVQERFGQWVLDTSPARATTSRTSRACTRRGSSR